MDRQIDIVWNPTQEVWRYNVGSPIPGSDKLITEVSGMVAQWMPETAGATARDGERVAAALATRHAGARLQWETPQRARVAADDAATLRGVASGLLNAGQSPV